MKYQSILWCSALVLLSAVGLMTACDGTDVTSAPVVEVQSGIVFGDDGRSLALQADPETVVIDANDPETPVDDVSGKLFETTKLTATLLDPAGAPVADAEVVFGTSAGELASEGAPVLTNADGLVADTLRVFEDDPDEIMATATSGDLTLTVTVMKQFIPLNHPPVANAGADQEIECGTAVTLDGSGSQDPDSTEGTNDDIVLFEWIEDFGLDMENPLGEGETLELDLDLGVHTVTLRVTDAAGASSTDETVVTVADSLDPEISAELNPSVLWPPNHQMVDIEATVGVQDCGPVSITLVSVESSEPVNDIGDGNTEPDIQGVDEGEDYHFQLRAERSGTGSGRTYTVVYRAVDAAGNEAESTATVIVPHDQGH